MFLTLLAKTFIAIDDFMAKYNTFLRGMMNEISLNMVSGMQILVWMAFAFVFNIWFWDWTFWGMMILTQVCVPSNAARKKHLLSCREITMCLAGDFVTCGIAALIVLTYVGLYNPKPNDRVEFFSVFAVCCAGASVVEAMLTVFFVLMYKCCRHFVSRNHPAWPREFSTSKSTHTQTEPAKVRALQTPQLHGAFKMMEV